MTFVFPVDIITDIEHRLVTERYVWLV
jgi:hypothetical protein